MAEDNTQDMAMEDILSSIKNILEEDEAKQPVLAATPVSAVAMVENEPEPEPIIDEQAEVNIDDILELSPEMQIEEPVLEQPPEPEEINLDAELDMIEASPLGDDVSFEIAGDKEDIVLEPMEAPNATLGWEDFESDPFDAQERTSIAEEFAVESELEEVVLPEPEVVVEPEPQPVSQPEPNEDTADVSANIINNFAKMFAQSEPKIVNPEPAAHPVNFVGDGSKTIEDVVGNVIKQIIGAEVEQNWRANADYDTFAKQVIREQAKVWLDDNLPKVVEAIVKQEIERVMAKVGNHQ